MADATETAQSVMEQTPYVVREVIRGSRQYAIPAAIIGIGVGWLLVERLRDRARGREEHGSPHPIPTYYEADDYYRAATSP